MFMKMPAPRKRTRHEPDIRREMILKEAANVIGERGYNGFTIQELAQRCKLTNGGLLYHFGSKEQLLVSLLQDRDRRDKEAVRAMVGLLPPSKARAAVPMETVHKLLRAIVERNSTQPEFVRLFTMLQSEALNLLHPASTYFRERDAATLKSFTQMVAPHVAHPSSTARQIRALMCGLEEQWIRANQSFDLVAEWDRGIALLLPRSN